MTTVGYEWIFAKVLLIAVIATLASCGESAHEVAMSEDAQALPLILVADSVYDKRNNVNKFKSEKKISRLKKYFM
jgi:Na+/serine symporter